MAIVLMAAALVATPFFVDAFDSEVAQVAALCVAALPLGFWTGVALSWRGPIFFLVVGVVLGFCCWLALLAYLAVRYPGVSDPPVTAWLVRFGGGVAVSFATGAVCAAVTRGKKASEVLGIAGTVLGIIGTIIGFMGS